MGWNLNLIFFFIATFNFDRRIKTKNSDNFNWNEKEGKERNGAELSTMTPTHFLIDVFNQTVRLTFVQFRIWNYISSGLGRKFILKSPNYLYVGERCKSLHVLTIHGCGSRMWCGLTHVTLTLASWDTHIPSNLRPIKFFFFFKKKSAYAYFSKRQYNNNRRKKRAVPPFSMWECLNLKKWNRSLIHSTVAAIFFFLGFLFLSPSLRRKC